MRQHEKIDYVEYPTCDMEKTKAFFSEVFGWTFTDYGQQYTAFAHQGLDGGFFQSEQRARTENGSALIVFYSNNIEQTQNRIECAGGIILKPVFSFPGGKRFHFAEPGGSEFAVWSDC